MNTRRLYYDDSFLRTFAAQVLNCEQVVSSEPPAWQVTLDQTAFYPSSGGQPCDTGLLGEAAVLDVQDRGDAILHTLDHPLTLGTVTGAIDWERRFDHMQQHTGQHLLSAILQGRFALPTVSFHLGSEVSTIDVRGAEPLPAVLEAAERAVNDMIFEDRQVIVRYGTAEELTQQGVRKQVEREGILRAIEIEGVEVQPCGGTHVQRTGQIGMLLLRRATKIRQDWRIEFVCGARAARAARADYQRLRHAAERLKCAAEDIVPSAERVLAERDAQFKSLSALTERLAETEARLALLDVPAGPGGLRVIARVLEGVELVYLAIFATQLALAERTIAVLARKECGHLAFAQHPGSNKDMNALLKQVLEQLGGKGGGTRDFARGALANAAQSERAVQLAESLLSQVQAAGSL
jgi:alanyl-tRNA synthetase